MCIFHCLIVNHPNLCSVVADGHGRLRRNSFTPNSVIGRHLVICLDSNFNWGHLWDEMACGLWPENYTVKQQVEVDPEEDKKKKMSWKQRNTFLGGEVVSTVECP